MPGGTIPPHDGRGPAHIAFSIAADELSAWDKRLADLGIEIEARTTWPRGGLSLYFRDLDRHLLARDPRFVAWLLIFSHGSSHGAARISLRNDYSAKASPATGERASAERSIEQVSRELRLFAPPLGP